MVEVCPWLHGSAVTRRTTVRISDVPRTPVRSLRCALQPTINITDVVRAGADRNLYFVPSYFGTNPCDPRDHLSRHLVVVGGGDRAGLSRPLVPRAGSVRIIRPAGPLLGIRRLVVTQGAFVFRSAHRHMAVPGDLSTTMTMAIYNWIRVDRRYMLPRCNGAVVTAWHGMEPHGSACLRLALWWISARK